MPRNPVNFRFQGIDGRGNVQLVRDPQGGRGPAVVRIEDPKGGSEGYTFDLEWSGGTGGQYGGQSGGQYGNGNPRYDPRYGNDPHRDDRYSGGYNDPRYNRGGNSNRAITCSSDDGRRTYCDADTRDGVRLVRQRSDASCRQGSTWGYDRRGIWVDRGCRADFEIGR